jgi:hypothetical protein
MEDIQAHHIDALEALDCAMLRLRRQARTAEDLRILNELWIAYTAVKAAWRVISAMHPDGEQPEASHE